MNEFDEQMMHRALALAQSSAKAGDVPVGAVLVKDREILSEAGNACEALHDATAHAEMRVLSEACRKIASTRLSHCTLYVTMEPCPMCAGALIHARLGRVVYGAKDARAGALGSLVNLTAYPLESRPEVEGGVLAQESERLLSDFFGSLRKKGKNFS